MGISGSPRKGNTLYLVKEALNAAKARINELNESVEVEIEVISFKGKTISPCIDCKACIRKRTICVIDDDWNILKESLVNPIPAGLIIGSPVYFFGPNAILRAFFERFTCMKKKYWFPDHGVRIPDWTCTAAGALAVGYHRTGGQEHTLASIIHWLLTCGFVTVGSYSRGKGPVGYIGGNAWEGINKKRGKSSVQEDVTGVESARIVGERVGETALYLSQGKQIANKN